MTAADLPMECRVAVPPPPYCNDMLKAPKGMSGHDGHRGGNDGEMSFELPNNMGKLEWSPKEGEGMIKIKDVAKVKFQPEKMRLDDKIDGLANFEMRDGKLEIRMHQG